MYSFISGMHVSKSQWNLLPKITGMHDQKNVIIGQKQSIYLSTFLTSECVFIYTNIIYPAVWSILHHLLQFFYDTKLEELVKFFFSFLYRTYSRKNTKTAI